MLKVYGYVLPKLPDNKLWIDVNALEGYGYEDSPYVLDVESAVDPACHVYTDLAGNQIVGFEISLGMTEHEMNQLLNNAAEKSIHRVSEF